MTQKEKMEMLRRMKDKKSKKKGKWALIFK
jgi:hypothetical protein